MNYMIITNTNTPSTKVPPNVVQMFTDEDMTALANFIKTSIDDLIENHNHEALSNSPGFKAAHTFMHLLGQWEKETQ